MLSHESGSEVSINNRLDIAVASVITVKNCKPWNTKRSRECCKDCRVAIIHSINYGDTMLIKIVPETSRKCMNDQVFALPLHNHPTACEENFATNAPGKSFEGAQILIRHIQE